MKNPFKKKRDNACKTFFKKLGYALAFITIYPVYIVHSLRTVSKIKKEEQELLRKVSSEHLSEIEILKLEKKLMKYKTTKTIISSYSTYLQYGKPGMSFLFLIGVPIEVYRKAGLINVLILAPLYLTPFLIFVCNPIYIANKTSLFILWSKILPKNFEQSLLNNLFEPPLQKLLEEQFQQTRKPLLKKPKGERKETKELRVERLNSTPNMHDLIFLQKINEFQLDNLAILEETLDLLKITHKANYLIKEYYLFCPEQLKRLNTYRYYNRDLIDPYYDECIKELNELADAFKTFNLGNDPGDIIFSYLFPPEKTELCDFYRQLNRKREVRDTKQISFLSDTTKRLRKKTKAV